MKHPMLDSLLLWLRSHRGIFTFQEENGDLLVMEAFSTKTLKIKSLEIDQIEEQQNAVIPGETYIIILFKNGRQLVLSSHGFAFPPDFTNTGPIPLPSQVYCMQDFQDLFSKLKHLASEAERRQEALALIMLLISILDGAKAVHLDTEAEDQQIDDILTQLEKGNVLPSPHLS
jgi:hypothetical protein